jgi:O-antigen/teichoic acid export membrane protein
MGKTTKSSAILIGTYVTTSIMNYAFGVALSWFYKPAQYGVLGVAQSLLLLISLVVGSGFAWTVAHDIAVNGIDDETRAGIRTALLINTCLGVIFALILILAYTSGLVPFGPAYRLVIPLVGLTTVILSARSVINGAARGRYDFFSLGLNLTGEVVVKIIIGLALVAAGFGVTGVMIGFVAGAAASLIHSLWITRSMQWWKGKSWFNPKILPATAPLFVGMMGSALMLNLDVLGLKLFSPGTQGDSLAGLYQAAVILARTPVFIAQALTIVLFSYAAGDKNHKKASYIDAALRVWARLLLPCGLVLIAAPDTALALFFPANYQGGELPLQLAALGGVILALITLLIGVFQAEGERTIPAIAAGVATLVQITVLAWLVPHFGALAAAISLIVAGLVSLVGLSPLLFKKYLSLTSNGLPQDFFWRLARIIFPLDVLLLYLILLPDDGVHVDLLIKFVIAGFLYLDAMLITYLPSWLINSKWQNRSKPVVAAAYYFIQVLMGG